MAICMFSVDLHSWIVFFFFWGGVEGSGKDLVCIKVLMDLSDETGFSHWHCPSLSAVLVFSSLSIGPMALRWSAG